MVNVKECNMGESGQNIYSQAKLWPPNLSATWLVSVPVGEGERQSGAVLAQPSVHSCPALVLEGNPVIRAAVGAPFIQQTADECLLEPVNRGEERSRDSTGWDRMGRDGRGWGQERAKLNRKQYDRIGWGQRLIFTVINLLHYPFKSPKWCLKVIYLVWPATKRIPKVFLL